MTWPGLQLSNLLLRASLTRQPTTATCVAFLRSSFVSTATTSKLRSNCLRSPFDLDENYGPAYLALATAYALAHDYYGEPFEEMRELALETIEKGVSVDPRIEDASWAIHGRIFHQEKEWSKSEAAYLRAINAEVVDSNAFSWYSRMLASTGRLEKARDIALIGENLDPDNAMVNSRIAMAQTWLGDDSEAYKYFGRSNALGATGNLHIMSNALLLYRDGKADESKMLSLAATKLTDTPSYWVEPVYEALADCEAREMRHWLQLTRRGQSN